MIERLEGTFWGYQDVELYYQLWRPVAQPNENPTQVQGTLLVTHGIAEHSDCYQRFAEDMAAKGWLVFVWDLRGHGRSEGKRGYVNRFQDFSNDLDAAIRYVKAQVMPKDKPLILFGHSMGGLITLQTVLIHSPSQIAALVLSSPALGLSLTVPPLKEKAARFLSDWLPKLTLYNEINFDDLIRDENLVREYKADPLRHDKISPRLFLGMVDAFTEVNKMAADIHLPVLMQLAGREKVVSTPVAEKFFDQLSSKKKEVYIYADSYHEIYNDLDRNDVLNDLVRFLESLKPGS
jgi:alpha-beta hydrolase superfamily lysophospholipase